MSASLKLESKEPSSVYHALPEVSLGPDMQLALSKRTGVKTQPVGLSVFTDVTEFNDLGG